MVSQEGEPPLDRAWVRRPFRHVSADRALVHDKTQPDKLGVTPRRTPAYVLECHFFECAPGFQWKLLAARLFGYGISIARRDGNPFGASGPPIFSWQMWFCRGIGVEDLFVLARPVLVRIMTLRQNRSARAH